VRTTKPVLLTFNARGYGLQLNLQMDSMELAGDLVQDLFGRYLKAPEIDCECTFPGEMARLGELVTLIDQHNQLKTHFSANIADSINNLKVQIVRAEASLMISDLEAVMRAYAQVQQENGALVGEYIKRQNNHGEMVAALKELNGMIRCASNMRVGTA
jgi:hypothetical protein